MIGLDTNVLLRFLLQDDERQARAADETLAALSEEEPGYVTLVTLVETVWVLSRTKRLDRAGIPSLVRGLVESGQLVVQQASVVRDAVRDFERSSADFAYALVARLSADADCEYTLTFDRKAAQLPGMRLLES